MIRKTLSLTFLGLLSLFLLAACASDNAGRETVELGVVYLSPT